MESKNFMTVDEVAQELNVSKSYAYKVVRELNAEMQKLGYLTVTGIPASSARSYVTANKTGEEMM